MKLRLFTLLLAVAAIIIPAKADVYVLGKPANVSGNEIITAGLNKPFPMDEYKQSLRSGKRLIAMGYTRLNGWVLSMADGTGIRLQHVSISPEWPEAWLEDEWQEGYQVSAVGYGQGQWCVVTSLNCGLSQQICYQGDWELIRPNIREEWSNSDRRITSLCSNGQEDWVVVMSLTDESSGQRYDFKHNWKRMEPIVEHYFANDYYIGCLSYGFGNIGVVFNQGDGRDTPRQICVTDPMELRDYLNEGYVVTHIGNNM